MMIALEAPLKKPKTKPAVLTLDEPGTPHRQAHALRLGDVPEDAASTDTPGKAVRRYNINDMLSWAYRRGVIGLRAYEGGLKWKEDFTIAGKEPRVTARLNDSPRGGVESFAVARLKARKRFQQAGEYLTAKEYAACFGIVLLDEALNKRTVELKSGLRALADWYGVAFDS